MNRWDINIRTTNFGLFCFLQFLINMKIERKLPEIFVAQLLPWQRELKLNFCKIEWKLSINDDDDDNLYRNQSLLIRWGLCPLSLLLTSFSYLSNLHQTFLVKFKLSLCLLPFISLHRLMQHSTHEYEMIGETKFIAHFVTWFMNYLKFISLQWHQKHVKCGTTTARIVKKTWHFIQ